MKDGSHSFCVVATVVAKVAAVGVGEYIQSLLVTPSRIILLPTIAAVHATTLKHADYPQETLDPFTLHITNSKDIIYIDVNVRFCCITLRRLYANST